MDYLQSNIIALKNIVEFSKNKKIKKFIYLSSFKIYGNIQSKVIKDCNSFESPCMLGATKILAEKIIETQKFPFLNIRLPGVVSYYINDFRRPWINNIIDTVEIYKFIKHIISKKSIKNSSLNFAAQKPIKIKNMIYYLKKMTLSNSKIIFMEKKSNHFIISSTNVKKYYKFKIADTYQILKRFVLKNNNTFNF